MIASQTSVFVVGALAAIGIVWLVWRIWNEDRHE